MSNGLKTRDIKTIHAILKKYPQIKQVCLFGSRALGTFKLGSDIDLAVMNDGVGSDTIGKIKGELEDSSLPYFVDLVIFSEIKHKEFKEHIAKVGVDFYIF